MRREGKWEGGNGRKGKCYTQKFHVAGLGGEETVQLHNNPSFGMDTAARVAWMVVEDF